MSLAKLQSIASSLAFAAQPTSSSRSATSRMPYNCNLC